MLYSCKAFSFKKTTSGYMIAFSQLWVCISGQAMVFLGMQFPTPFLAPLPVWVRLAQLEGYAVIPFSQLQAQRRGMWVPSVVLVAGFIADLCRLPSFCCKSS